MNSHETTRTSNVTVSVGIGAPRPVAYFVEHAEPAMDVDRTEKIDLYDEVNIIVIFKGPPLNWIHNEKLSARTYCGLRATDNTVSRIVSMITWVSCCRPC